jgi:hypothetical protein
MKPYRPRYPSLGAQQQQALWKRQAEARALAERERQAEAERRRVEAAMLEAMRRTVAGMWSPPDDD